MTWIESLLHDCRYGVRSLIRERLSTGAVVAMLALGIGSSGVAGLVRIDAAILAAVGTIYFVIALAATYIPARRAFELDAMRTLKSD